MNILHKLVFVTGKPFQPSLMFVIKAGAYSSGAPTGSCLPGRLLALSTNIRLGWKCLPVTNDLTYYGHSLITNIKSFKALGLGRDHKQYLAGKACKGQTPLLTSNI
jgi:hypothetical protein